MTLTTLQLSTLVLAEDKPGGLSNQGGTTLDYSLRPCSDAVDEGFFISGVGRRATAKRREGFDTPETYIY